MEDQEVVTWIAIINKIIATKKIRKIEPELSARLLKMYVMESPMGTSLNYMVDIPLMKKSFLELYSFIKNQGNQSYPF